MDIYFFLTSEHSNVILIWSYNTNKNCLCGLLPVLFKEDYFII